VPETIAAIATAAGRGAVGIVRVSGALASTLIERLAGRAVLPRVATLCPLRDAQGQPLDQALVLYFPAPHSFTGEDIAEFQCHGGPVVLAAVLQALCDGGARLAEAGEFSQRAYLNDKLNLAQAEAIADLINAQSQAAARAALANLGGALTERVEGLQQSLLELRALVEASLDFSDEDLPPLHQQRVDQRLETLIDALQKLLAQTEQARQRQEGLTVVLAGQPNVGKSTLLNHLAGYEAAIVSDIAGTTRDVLRESVVLQGFPVMFVDTAGLRLTQDRLEQAGIARTHQQIKQADAVLYLVDATVGWQPQDQHYLETIAVPVLKVFNKADCAQQAEADSLRISAKTGEGIESLVTALLKLCRVDNAEEVKISARQRHKIALKQALIELCNAQKIKITELIAQHLYEAAARLSSIAGKSDTEAVLEQIFSQFCVGK
jgi:tRNA modification GTPase